MLFGYKAAWSNAGTGGATWAEAEALAQRLAEDEQTLKRRFWQKLRALAARLPFAEDLVAAHYCAFDRQTPLHVAAPSARSPFRPAGRCGARCPFR